MKPISLLSSLLLLFFSAAQAQEILLVPVFQFGVINVEITLVSSTKPWQGAGLRGVADRHEKPTNRGLFEFFF